MSKSRIPAFLAILKLTNKFNLIYKIKNQVFEKYLFYSVKVLKLEQLNLIYE